MRRASTFSASSCSTNSSSASGSPDTTTDRGPLTTATSPACHGTRCPHEVRGLGDRRQSRRARQGDQSLAAQRHDLARIAQTTTHRPHRRRDLTLAVSHDGGRSRPHERHSAAVPPSPRTARAAHVHRSSEGAPSAPRITSSRDSRPTPPATGAHCPCDGRRRGLVVQASAHPHHCEPGPETRTPRRQISRHSTVDTHGLRSRVQRGQSANQVVIARPSTTGAVLEPRPPRHQRPPDISRFPLFAGGEVAQSARLPPHRSGVLARQHPWHHSIGHGRRGLVRDRWSLFKDHVRVGAADAERRTPRLARGGRVPLTPLRQQRTAPDDQSTCREGTSAFSVPGQETVAHGHHGLDHTRRRPPPGCARCSTSAIPANSGRPGSRSCP